MLVAHALSHCAPLRASEIPLDITINHEHITPDRKTEFWALIQDGLLLWPLAETIIVGWPDDINDAHILYAHTTATETSSQLKMASSFLHQKGRRSSKQYMKDPWKSASSKTEPATMCLGLESTQTSNA